MYFLNYKNVQKQADVNEARKCAEMVYGEGGLYDNTTTVSN